jgi:signal transduction histidine kinase/GAF domain-containing protein
LTTTATKSAVKLRSTPVPSLLSAAEQEDKHHRFDLPRPERPHKILIVDDDEKLITGLKINAEKFYAGFFDIRGYSPKEDNGLFRELNSWRAAHWEPDLIALDINIANATQSGHSYLKEMNENSLINELFSIPKVLMTQPSLSKSKEENGGVVGADLDPYRLNGAESILYEKTASASFLGRLGINLLNWQHLARTRCWINLLQLMALQAVNPEISEEALCTTLLNYLQHYFKVEAGFVRRNYDQKNDANDDQIELTLSAWTQYGYPVYKEEEKIPLAKMPLWQEIMKHKEGYINNGARKEESGVFYDRIKNKSILAVPLIFDEMKLGLISLVGQKSKEQFTDKDRTFLLAVAQFLSSRIGRGERNHRLSEKILHTADLFAKANSVDAVCELLANSIHEECFDNEDRLLGSTKTGVRLITPGTFELTRHAIVGTNKPADTIFLNNEKSTYAESVRTGRILEGLADNSSTHSVEDNIDGSPKFKRYLTVPIKFGNTVLGAVNAEKVNVKPFERYKQSYAEALARHACARIQAIRQLEVAQALSVLATLSRTDSNKSIWPQIYLALATHTQASCILHFTEKGISNQSTLTNPLTIKDIFYLSKPDNARNDTASWQKFVDNNWSSTFIVKTWIKNQKPNWVYSIDDNDYVDVKELLGGYSQKADALLTLRDDKDHVIGLFALLWFMIPTTIGDTLDTTVEQIAKFASKQQQWDNDEAINQSKLAEQSRLAETGAATHFINHVFNNAVGGIKNQLDLTQEILKDQDTDVVREAVKHLTMGINKLSSLKHVSKAYAYVATPVSAFCDPIEIWKKAVSEDIAEKASTHEIRLIHEPKFLGECPALVFTDAKLLSLVFYILVDNAIDAIATRNKKIQQLLENKIWLSINSDESYVYLTVHDTGPGVDPSMKDRLFTLGGTSKTHGQGTALFFMRNKLRLINADLSLHENKMDDVGASFQISILKVI